MKKRTDRPGSGLPMDRRALLLGLGSAALLAACQDSAEAGQDLADAGDSAAGGAGDGAGQGTGAAVSPKGSPQDNPLPAISANEQHYVTSCCGTPELTAQTWQLQFLYRGAPLATATLADLKALPARTKEHTLACISAGPKHQAYGNAVWTGLPLVEILAALKVAVPTDTPYLHLTAKDGYTTGLPASDLQRPIWLVWQMNGADIPADHGFPVRMLVPGRFGMKNPKWLTKLEFSDKPLEGFWEHMGWSDTALYRPCALVSAPLAGPIKAGTVRVAGMAYAGSDPVVKVEVRVDKGPWQLATLDYAPGADVWALWHWDWPATAGSHSVQARCTTASGAASLDSEGGAAGPGLEGYGGSMTAQFAVT